MKKFKYRVLVGPSEKDLEQYGAQGWEICGVAIRPGAMKETVYLKYEFNE